MIGQRGARREDHAVRTEREQLIDVRRCSDAARWQAEQLGNVRALLLRRVGADADQLELGLGLQIAQYVLPDTAGPHRITFMSVSFDLGPACPGGGGQQVRAARSPAADATFRLDVQK